MAVGRGPSGKEEGIGANAPRGNGPTARRAERTEGPAWFTSRRGRGRRRRGRRGAKQTHFGERRGAKRTQFRRGVGGQGTGAGEECRRRGDAPAWEGPKGPRPPAPRRSERTERGTGWDGRPVTAEGSDSERTERGDGGAGQGLPGDRAGAERTEDRGPAPKTNPIRGRGAAKTDPIAARIGGGRGRWGMGQGGWRLEERGAERTHRSISFTSRRVGRAEGAGGRCCRNRDEPVRWSDWEGPRSAPGGRARGGADGPDAPAGVHVGAARRPIFMSWTAGMAGSFGARGRSGMVRG
jgi:hypothetical protein